MIYSPFWLTVLILVLIGLIWLALRAQAGRADLHETGHDHAGHDHTDYADHANDNHAHAMPAEPEPAEPPAPAAPPVPVAPAAPDDLRKIEGIGPKVAAVLNGIGITTFTDLAAADLEKVNAALAAAGYQYMNPDSWSRQAKLAAAGDWDGLTKMQAELKGGM